MRLHTLGGLRLEGSDFRRPKALLLLAYLTLEGPQERHHLAELFWPGAVRARTDLSTTLSRLRKHAPSSVEADAAKVWSSLESDHGALFQAIEQGQLSRATGLYQGKFLAGFDTKALGAELEEWLYSTREFLAAQVQKVQLQLAETEAARKHFKAAAQRAETAFQLTKTLLEPEALLRIHTLLLAGNSYYVARVVKVSEGFELPFANTQDEAKERLQERLGLGESAISHNLPSKETSFIGRELELAEINQLLAEHRLVTLLGPGGVGKSRLALQVAAQQLHEAQFHDGVFFVGLEALSTVSSIPTGIATALEYDLQGDGDPSVQIARRIGRKTMLLVLDNFEHLIEGATLASDLLQACPNLRLLITSRERLHLAEEWLFEVGGLAFPTSHLGLEEAKPFDAVQLFTQRARQASPTFVFSTKDLKPILKICQLVEGLPLALELAATWVRVMSRHDIVKELEHNLDLLTTSTRNISDKHKSVEASFEHSYKLLSPKEQEVLRKLSVFKGGFRREAAAEVAGASLVTLAALVDKSLLRLNVKGRYNSHPLLYQFCQNKLAEHSEEEQHIQSTYGHYYLTFVSHREEALNDDRMKEASGAIRAELDNIRAAWHWAAKTHHANLIAKSVRPIRWFYAIHEYNTLCLEDFSFVIEQLDLHNPEHHLALARVMICLCRFEPNLEKASFYARQGITLVRPLNDIKSRWQGLAWLAAFAAQTGDFKAAHGYIEEALTIPELPPDGRTDNILRLAEIFAYQGNYQEAIRIFESEKSLVEQTNFYYGFLGRYCEVQFLDKQYHRALQTAQELMSHYSTTHHSSNLALAPFLVALAHFQLGQYDEAEVYIQDMILMAQSRWPRRHYYALLLLSAIATAKTDYSKAICCLKEALSRIYTSDATPNIDIHHVLVYYANLYMYTHQEQRAIELLCRFLIHLETLKEYNLTFGTFVANQLHKQWAQTWLESLSNKLSKEQYQNALERGKTLPLNTILEELLLDIPIHA